MRAAVLTTGDGLEARAAVAAGTPAEIKLAAVEENSPLEVPLGPSVNPPFGTWFAPVTGPGRAEGIGAVFEPKMGI